MGFLLGAAESRGSDGATVIQLYPVRTSVERDIECLGESTGCRALKQVEFFQKETGKYLFRDNLCGTEGCRS